MINQKKSNTEYNQFLVVFKFNVLSTYFSYPDYISTKIDVRLPRDSLSSLKSSKFFV